MSSTKKQLIFKSGDLCKVCASPVYYFNKQWYTKGHSDFVICPTCNNEIQITE